MNIIDLVRFTALLFRRGRLRQKGYDFSEERNRILRGILEPRRNRSAVTTRLIKIPYLGPLIAEAAFVKRSMRLAGGHLESAEGKIAYVRIPKAASTAACKAILQHRFPNLQTDAMTPQQINAVADHYMQRKSARTEGREMFTMVRNPFARIVSVYREFFELATGRFLYDDYLLGIFSRNISFRQFVDTVRAIPDHLKDQHLMPQDCLLRYYDVHGIAVHIFQLEQVGAAAAYLAAQGLRLDVIHTSPQGYDYRRYYDRHTLEQVKEIYGRDISRFGYQDAYDEIKFAIEQRDVHI